MILLLGSAHCSDVNRGTYVALTIHGALVPPRGLIVGNKVGVVGKSSQNLPSLRRYFCVVSPQICGLNVIN